MGSEGYFIKQFLVTHTNQRRDAWGGTYENRMRLPVNTGIGWHEARIPTIATSLPRGAFAWVTKKTRDELHAAGLTIPLVTSNRINTPDVAEQILAGGNADLVSLARPLLADPDFVAKAKAGRGNHPRRTGPRGAPVRIGRPHRRPVRDGDAHSRQGRICRDAALLRAPTRSHRRRAAPGPAHRRSAQLVAQHFDAVLLATGVAPRDPKIPGQDSANVLGYIDVLLHRRPVHAAAELDAKRAIDQGTRLAATL